jgi:hypothetical protein
MANERGIGRKPKLSDYQRQEAISDARLARRWRIAKSYAVDLRSWHVWNRKSAIATAHQMQLMVCKCEPERAASA